MLFCVGLNHVDSGLKGKPQIEGVIKKRGHLGYLVVNRKIESNTEVYL
jgi:hypothetical protein